MPGEENGELSELQRGVEDRPVPQTLVCTDCGYNLTGVCTEERQQGNCPECGKPFIREDLIAWGLESSPPPPLGWAIGGLFVWPAVAVVSIAMVPLVDSAVPAIIGMPVWVGGGVVQSAVAAIRLIQQTLDRRVAYSDNGWFFCGS